MAIAHVLVITRNWRQEIAARWRSRGIRAVALTDDEFVQLLSTPIAGVQPVFDALVVIADGTFGREFSGGTALRFVMALHSIPDDVTMPDGRRWKTVPVFAIAVDDDLNSEFLVYPDEPIQVLPEDFYAANIISAVLTYRQRILDQLDRLGFVVTYEAGRYRVGPALEPRSGLESYYYFGPGDRRSGRVVTVARDLLGLRLEVEQFEALINRADVKEHELQKFFEDHPEFLSALEHEVLAHVRLEDPGRSVLIPDFILKPLAGRIRDARWEVLELKLPQTKLLVGKPARSQLSYSVMKAIRQLRAYGDYFANDRNADSVERTLGYRLRHPRLAVLIGRSAGTDLEALVLEKSRLPDVRLVTYDEILEEQRGFL